MLDRIRASRAGLDAIVAPLSDERLTLAGPEGWSIKDHLAHITAWEQIALGRVRGKAEHEVYGVTPDAVPSLDLDRLNEVLHERTRDLPPEQVREAARDSYAEIMAYLAGITDAELQAQYDSDDPRSRAAKIAGNTYAHYDEHAEWIDAVLASG